MIRRVASLISIVALLSSCVARWHRGPTLFVAHSRHCIDLEQLAQHLFAKECGGKAEHLAYWSPHEPYPSFGIGHFIWLEHSLEGFPALLREFKRQGIAYPKWLDTSGKCPWSTREQFQQDRERLKQMRQLLWTTRTAQARFVAQNFDRKLLQLERNHPQLRPRIDQLLATSKGVWALIDYSHFKGMGLDGRHAGKARCGLVQVLQGMEGSDPLVAFVASAERLLRTRADKSSDQVFLPGWLSRLHSYLK